MVDPRPDEIHRRRRRTTSTRFAVGVLAAFIALLAAAPSASAHAVLVSSDPQDGADLNTAPTQVSITFDEAVGLRPGYLQVIDGTGRRVDAGAAFHPDGHDDVVSVRLRGGLGRAGYLASYRVISADSHPVSGVVQFTVGGAAPAERRPGGRSDNVTVSVLFDVARSVTFFGLALIGGTWLLLFAGHVRTAATRARTAATRARTTSTRARAEPDRGWRLVGCGVLLAVTGLGAEFVLQGPYAAGAPVSAATERALLADTVTSAFGRWHVTAIVLLGALTVATLRLRRDGLGGRGVLLPVAVAGWVATLVAVAESGHAGVRSPVWLGLPVTVAHLLAMTTWIGGLSVLAFADLPHAGRTDETAMTARVLTTFSRTALICVATLAVSGTYQAWQEVGSWSALVGTRYGILVLTKIELFAVLVALGAVARARVAAWPGPVGQVPAPGLANATASSQLRAGVLVELGVAALVLCVSGVLVAEPPGRDVSVSARASASREVTARLSATRTVTLRVTPGTHGPVTIEVAVSSGRAVRKLTVTAAQNGAGIGPLPIPVHATGDVYRSSQVNLPVAGDWQFSITVQTSEFDVATATPTLHLD